MKVRYTTGDGRISVEIDGADTKTVFKEIAQFQEVFENDKCQCCGGTELRFQVRVVEDNEYPEIKCQNPKCNAALSMGQNKKGGGLYPKRKIKVNGEERYDTKHKGWQVYKRPGAKTGEQSDTQAGKSQGESRR